MSAYDPESMGALCGVCILKTERAGDPVPPEIHMGAQAMIIAEAPGETEVEQGRPLCGSSGQETMDALRAHGLAREHFSYTNSVICRPPNNNMDLLLHRLQQENTRRKAENKSRAKEDQLPLLPTPQQACRPRLLREIEESAFAAVDAEGKPERLLNIIAMGKYSWNAITQAADSIGAVRGGPAEGWLARNGSFWSAKWPAVDPNDSAFIPAHLRIMPTNHAAFVLRAPKWRPAFRGDFGRAFRWWSGRRTWKTPQVWFNPPVHEIRNFLSRANAFAVDFETDGKEPLVAQIRCLGICDMTGDFGLSIHFLSIDGVTRFYTEEEQAEVEQVCKDFLADASKYKIGHNFDYYDKALVRARWGVTPVSVVDTIVGARLADSELPKSLAYVASVYTDAPSWKKDKKALTAQTDEELGTYCIGDTSADARSLSGLMEAAQRNQQMHLWPFFAKNQEICLGMHENGMFVDEGKRREWDAKLAHSAKRWLSIARGRAGLPELNPNSTVQLRGLLFSSWQLPAEEFTKLGDPSTSDEVLRRMLKGSSSLTREQKLLVKAIRKFRRASKLRGTYVVPLRPSSELAVWDVLSFNEDEQYEESEVVDGKPLEWDPRSAAEREKDRKKEKKPGLTLPDGRVHPNFSAHATTSGRFNSSAPNAQNFWKKLRSMIRAAKGNTLVACDQSQLELRVAAAIWNCERYIESFLTGGDPHLVTCRSVYGSDFDTKYGPEMRDKLRAFAKRFSYACAERNTPVAVLDARGQIPIKDAKAGDWTWCWDGEKYAPTRMKEVRCHGLRQCVRVTYKWKTPENAWTTASSIFTPDHLFMLRDGSYRAAGELAVGTSLMPFRRWKVGAYRVLDPFNDGGRMGEHRRAYGATPGDGTHVHHEDHNEQNNVPENLRALTPKQHTNEHWNENDKRAQLLAGVATRIWSPENREVTNAKLTAGRVNSAKWRESVKIGVAAMQAALAKKRADGTLKPRKKQASKLDPFVDKIGVLTDREVATLAGVTKELVGMYRKKRGIAAPPKQRKNHVVVSVEPVGEHEVWDIEVEHPAHNFAIADGLFVHNCIYGASLETVHDTLTSSEDARGNLLFPDLSIRETRRAMKAWLGANPEIARGWEGEVGFFRQHGYLEEPIVGHRRFFRDGEDRNELLNFRCQSAGSMIVHKSTHRLVDEFIPFGKWGPGTGLIQQGHDSLCIECPVEQVEYVKHALLTCMSQPVPQLANMSFKGDVKVGLSWDKV